jgi:hypothetical protein
MFDISKFEVKPVIIIDDSPQKYKIQIYLFSIESGKGNAYYTDENEVVSKIIIHATGKSNYDNTIFTRGMDDGKPFEVNGIAKKVDGKLKQITCEL